MEKIDKLKTFFREAKAYNAQSTHEETNLKYAAVKNLLEGKQKFYVHANQVKQMLVAIDFVKEFGFKAGEAWSEITEYAYGCLSYSDFATTEMLIPEGSEHLFKDIYTAKADELYHHVLDKFGWAWRDPKYKSETELCAMLKWAKEKGLKQKLQALMAAPVRLERTTP